MTLKIWVAVLLVSSVASGRLLLESDTAGSRTLPRFAQCGGSGGNCDQYSSCDNSPFDGYSCSAGDVCNAVDDSYWQCEEAATPALEIAAYAQCGGINCEPALGDTASQTSCEDAPWSGAVCSDDSTSCQRQDDQLWQCLPTDTTAEEASSEEEAASEEDASSEEEEASPEEEASSEDASNEEEASAGEDPASEEEASPEEEASSDEASSAEASGVEEAPLEEEASTEEEPASEAATESTPDADSDDSDASEGMASVLRSAEAMGAKALGGVKSMGTQAVNAVKSMAADDDEEEEDSPPPTASGLTQDDSTETQSQDASVKEIAAYAQCGGINCRPVLGDAANDIICENAAWSNAACADISTSCQRVDDYMWQCLPTDAAGDAADDLSPEAADTDSEEEEEASALGSAKAMGLKALGGAKAMGVKAINAAKTMTTEEDEEEVSPSPEATQAAETDDSSDEQDDSASDKESILETLILPEGETAEDTSADESEDDSTEDSRDLDILTFVFNVECLQSALYSCALDGDAGPVAAGGAVTGCTSANLPDGYVVEETREFSQAKKQHVQFLQSKLQVQCPAIDLTAFTAVANAAVDVGSSQTFNALTPQFTVEASPMNIFLAAFFLEDVAVAMYQGLIPSILSEDLRAAVTGMMADTAYHAGIVRDVAAMNAASDTGYTMTNAATDATADAQLNVHDFLSGLAQLRDTLDNTNDDNSSRSTDMGLSSLNGKRSATGVKTDDNGFTFARTPGQVLAILFGNSNKGIDTGLFFPEGVLGSNSLYTAVS